MKLWLLALVLKPFYLFCYSLFVWLCNSLVHRFMPDCWLKRLLLRPILEDRQLRRNRAPH